LSGNQIGQAGCIALAQALPYSLELRELNMTNNMMNDEAANAFAESLTDRHCGFERLHWEGNPSLSQEGVKTLQHAVQYRKNSRTWLKPSFIQQVQSDRCGSINWMCKETISDFEVRKLASILLQSKGISRLTVFYLGGVDISAKGIKAIAEWIGSPGCSLKRFFVRNTSMGDEGAASIADALESNTSLQELSLTGSHITAAGAASLGQSCAENETLTRLSLAYNHIGATGLLALARGVRLSKGLVSLNVMSNQIAIPKNSGIWDALSNSSIRELTLRDNAIDDDIIIDFVHSLRDQCPFRKLDFIDNQITDKGAWLLSKLLEEYHVQFFY
jgi:Ran GTPase-activating protein (RanGAP) involved in mRNA processing and transport